MGLFLISKSSFSDAKKRSNAIQAHKYRVCCFSINVAFLSVAYVIPNCAQSLICLHVTVHVGANCGQAVSVLLTFPMAFPLSRIPMMSYAEKPEDITKEEWMDKLNNVHIQRADMNRLIMNYLVTGEARSSTTP